MIYGYARCSTDESKQDITRQFKDLKALGVDKKDNIFFDYASGTKRDRESFNQLINKTQAGDTIITTEVSRLSRSTSHLCEIIDIAKAKQLKLVIGNTMTIDCSKGELDPMTNAFLQMSGVFAELERNMISQRVKSGMANAKAKGAKIGRPTTSYDDIPATFLKHYPKVVSGQINMSELARLCQLTRQSCYKYKAIYDKENSK